MTDARTVGRVGVAAGVLYAAMVAWERAAGFSLGDPGAAVAVQQTGIVLAMLGFVVLAVGLWRARPGGDGALARAWPLLVAFGWAALAAAIPVEVLGDVTSEQDPLNPIGGLTSMVGLLGLGVTVARAGRWTSWRRWAPLALGALHAGLLVSTILTGDWPHVLVEVAWALGYSVLGAALLVEDDVPVAAPVG